jgi:hypothetical protein
MGPYRLQNIIKRVLQEETQLLNEAYSPPGAFNVTGTYKDVKPNYTFRSQGPIPGRIHGPGYDFESKGPEGVNYFMEEEDEGANPWAICTSSLGLEGKKRKDYTNLEKGKYEKCVLGMKKKIKESRIKSVINRVLKEEGEDIAATLYKQDTSYRDTDTGEVVASTEMLDRMNAKLDALTTMVTAIQDNLSRDWV